ncbi:MAG: serine/threonine-protein kinase [Sandaracinaceae bacterium]
MAGRQFGRYELIERIDIGGMAEVFRARQRGAAGFERVIAVKRILPYIAEDEEMRAMFVQEAKIAVQLNHPNIAQVFDLGQVDDHYFIAMELVEGQSLKALIERWRERGGPVPEDAACHMLVHVAEALHYAHFAEDSQGRPLNVIHRDVSPHNILLSYEGEVKVIDFGLAKAAGRAIQTRDGVVKGKLAYLSPEQAYGKPLDRRSDVFALGICAWEIFTGQRLFKRDDERQTLLAIRNAEIEPVSRYARVAPALEAIVSRALALEPEARFNTALAFREAIEEHQRAAGHRFARREMRALMRSTFPEHFAGTVEPGAAIELVQRKRPPPPPPRDPPTDEALELLDMAGAEDTSPTNPGYVEEPTDMVALPADDTQPGALFPDEP